MATTSKTTTKTTTKTAALDMSQSATTKTAVSQPAIVTEGMTDEAWTRLLDSITKLGNANRRAICTAHFAARRDLFNSKSVTRANQLLGCLKGRPELGKVARAFMLIAGGVKLESDGKMPYWVESLDKSVLTYKDGQLSLVKKLSKEAWSEALTISAYFEKTDYDCITVKKPEIPFTFENVSKFIRTLDKAKNRWSQRDAAFLRRASEFLAELEKEANAR